MSFPASTRLGPYEILSPLAAGGMGEIYRARDSRLGREVAVKVLPENLRDDPERLHRFQQEARAAGALNHPNVLTVHDAGEYEGRPYLVAELLEGETLRERLSRSPLPASKACEYALQIARGLAAAHAKGITHRDLKPENLFITRGGIVKILDFGLAKMSAAPITASGFSSAPTAGSLTAAGAVMGSAGYMAPEQVRGEEAGPRADIFSFGAILYEMLAGKRAFEGTSWYDAMNAVVQQDPPALPGTTPPALEGLVRCCLEKRPEDRYQSAHDLALALSSASESPRRRARAWRGSALPALAVLAVAGAAGLAWSLLAPKEPLTLSPVTFRHGTVSSARFTADGGTIAYSARWDNGQFQVYTTRLDSAESSKLDIGDAGSGALVLGVSRAGEVAVLLPRHGLSLYDLEGTLAQIPVAGGTPRERTEDVAAADWSPAGTDLALVRVEQNGTRVLEYRGKILYRTTDPIDYIRISPAGDRIAFLDHPLQADLAGAVKLVDVEGQARALSRRFNSVRGLAWSGNGKEIWFTAAEQGTNVALFAVSLSGKVRKLTPLPGYAVLEDISRDGSVLLSAHRLSISMFLVTPDNGSREDLYWHDASNVRDLSADGTAVLFSESGAATGGDFDAFLRRAGEVSPVRLGAGLPLALSPDAKWVIANPAGVPAQLRLLPVKSGQPRDVTRDAIHHVAAQWLPGGDRFVFIGHEKDHGFRYWVQAIDGGEAKPITTEDIRFDRGDPITISPNGKELALLDSAGRLVAVSIDDGTRRPIQYAQTGDIPLQWCEDQSLIVYRSIEPGQLYRVDQSTGRRAWRSLAPDSAVGFVNISPIRVSRDCRSCAYSTLNALTDLYVVRGLR